MKNFFTMLTLAGGLFLAGSAFAQTPATGTQLNPETGAVEVAPTPITKIEFTETQYDFGEIKQGDVVEHTFVFKNVGENDLVLENVKPTCGCTALDWPKEPIKPGESAEIQTRFNSRGKRGKQYKYFTVTYNGNPKVERVAFTGNVVVPTPPAQDDNGNITK